MPRRTKSAKTKQLRSSGVGDALVESMSEAVAWARGEIALPVREFSPKKQSSKARPTASELAVDLVFEGPGDRSRKAKSIEGLNASDRGDRDAQDILRAIGQESKRTGTDKLTSREIEREIAAARRKSRRRRSTVEELAGDLIGSLEGPGDLSTNPKYMEGFGRDNRPVRATTPKAGKKGTRESESGRLFVSFWHIELENLPVGSFIHRRIAPEDARESIAQARKDGALACCSQDDLLAPYHKDRRDDHKEMCKVLAKRYGIALTLRDFMTPPDESGSYTTFPLQFANVRGRNSLLVVTCMYMSPERRKPKSALPSLNLEIDPESVRFHLFESLGSAESARRLGENRKGSQ